MFIAAYDFDGNMLWQVRPGVFASMHGYCSSPVLWKDKVIVNGDHDGPSYIVALSRATGQTILEDTSAQQDAELLHTDYPAN